MGALLDVRAVSAWPQLFAGQEKIMNKQKKGSMRGECIWHNNVLGTAQSLNHANFDGWGCGIKKNLVVYLPLRFRSHAEMEAKISLTYLSQFFKDSIFSSVVMEAAKKVIIF